MKNGGYIIIDFLGADLSDTTEEYKIPGIYSAVKYAVLHNKPILAVNRALDDALLSPTFIEAAAEEVSSDIVYSLNTPAFVTTTVETVTTTTFTPIVWIVGDDDTLSQPT